MYIILYIYIYYIYIYTINTLNSKALYPMTHIHSYIHTPLIFFEPKTSSACSVHQALVALDCSATALRKGRCSSALNTAANVMASPTTFLGGMERGKDVLGGSRP